MTWMDIQTKRLYSILTIPAALFPVIHYRSPPCTYSGVQDALLADTASTLDLYIPMHSCTFTKACTDH